jgi:uncharacterized protein
VAVSGNVDGYEKSGFPPEIIVDLGGRRIAIRHILYKGGKLTKDGRLFLQESQPDLCIFGHTHQSKVEWFGKTLLFNPGSAGPKRFKLIRGLGLLRLCGTEVKPRLISLPDKAESHMLA